MVINILFCISIQNFIRINKINYKYKDKDISKILNKKKLLINNK